MPFRGGRAQPRRSSPPQGSASPWSWPFLSSSGSQPFWHWRPVLWKMKFFHGPGNRGWFLFCLLVTSCWAAQFITSCGPGLGWGSLPWSLPLELANHGLCHIQPSASFGSSFTGTRLPPCVYKLVLLLPKWRQSWEVVTELSIELPASYSNFPLAIYFTYGKAYVSMLLSQFFPLSPSPTVSKVFSLSLCLYFYPANRVHQQMNW